MFLSNRLGLLQAWRSDKLNFGEWNLFQICYEKLFQKWFVGCTTNVLFSLTIVDVSFLFHFTIKGRGIWKKHRLHHPFVLSDVYHRHYLLYHVMYEVCIVFILPCINFIITLTYLYNENIIENTMINKWWGKKLEAVLTSCYLLYLLFTVLFDGWTFS